MKYDGITRESLFLLSDNRFRDSKEFYEAHKEELKAGLTVPLRQIAGAVGEKLLSLDPLMNTVPTKMVSRIRRDTRYTKDMHLYRENMWIMFMRNKHEWINYPCFWFEITPSDYSLGIGLFGNEAKAMEIFRAHIRENPAEFYDACKMCEKTGAELYGDEYKRMPGGCPEGLEKYYIHKSFGFIRYCNNPDDLADEKIIGIINKTFKQFSPMYSFLLKVADEYFMKTEG